MQLGGDGHLDLTYCTNIHPGQGWNEVLGNLRHYGPALKRRLSPDAPFGLGLRLSNEESIELLHGKRLEEFTAFLSGNGLYVSILNGFPFGSFHRQTIKADVFAPDWRNPARLEYTLRLVRILKHLVPAGGEGGISTLPLSYKRWITRGNEKEWQSIVRNIVRVAEALARLKASEDILIHLDIEPEPDGLIENSAEIQEFYDKWLLPVGGSLLAEAMGVPVETARRNLLEHVRVCFDTCHLAVEYEDFSTVLKRFSRSGIKVGRLQISSALCVAFDGDRRQRSRLATELQAFAESTYLHQVIERREDGSLHRYADLIEALPGIHRPEAKEWRIHFHVPIFAEQCGNFGSTQAQIKTALNLVKRTSFTRHLEIETYTWDVLPPALKQDLLESVVREYQWVTSEFRS